MIADKKMKKGWKVFFLAVASLFVLSFVLGFGYGYGYWEGYDVGYNESFNFFYNESQNIIHLNNFNNVNRCMNYFCSETESLDCINIYEDRYASFDYCLEILTTEEDYNYSREFLLYEDYE